MKKIRVVKKTGFTSPDERIIIYDFRKILFYDTDWLNKKPKGFNLPKGIYYINKSQILIPLKHPVIIKFIPNPKPERRILRIGHYQIKFANNPNKATIYYDKQLIVFDNSFKTVPLYVIMFLFFHELGHFKYSTEWKCDVFAVNKMLKRGYNISQIGLAPLVSLSPRALYRQKLIIKSLLKA